MEFLNKIFVILELERLCFHFPLKLIIYAHPKNYGNSAYYIMKRVCWSRTEKISFSKVSIAMPRRSHVWNDFVSLSVECKLKTSKKHERNETKSRLERCTLSHVWASHDNNKGNLLSFAVELFYFLSRFPPVAAWQRKIAVRGMARESFFRNVSCLCNQTELNWLVFERSIEEITAPQHVTQCCR